ncbi:hypothetical protein EG832_13220 [bacterium]|nr:hypothetical protein [bacterium]
MDKIKETHHYLVITFRIFHAFTDITSGKLAKLMAIDNWSRTIFYNMPHWIKLYEIRHHN